MSKRAGSVSKYQTKTGKSRRDGEGKSKRAELWRYRFDADASDGTRRQMSAAGFTTRAAALNAMRARIEEYERPPQAAPPEPEPKETLADWVRAWLRDYAPQRCTPKTIERYQQLASYILDATDGEPAALAATPLDALTPAEVERTLYALLRIKAKRKEHLSPKSVREIAGVLSVSLNKAFRLGKILVNPLLRVELPKAATVKARSLTPDEIQQLRSACAGDWTFTFVELALATGARRGELLALTWPDVDWLTATLTVSKSVEETEADGIRIKTPKNGRPRKFRIGPTAIAALRFLHEQQQEYRRLYGEQYQHHDLVFSLPDGSYFLPHLVSQTIRRRVKKAGIKNASLHTLRHTHASILLSKNVPLPAVSARLGHADTNITARVYSHFLPEDDARAADAWEAVIRRPVQ